MNFYSVQQLLDYGASVQLLDYSGFYLNFIFIIRYNCIHYVEGLLVNQSGSNRDNKDRMIQLLQQQLMNEKEDPVVSRMNQAIIQARKQFPLAESAKVLQNAIFLSPRQMYFALYVKKEMKEDGFEVESVYSYEIIQVVWFY